MSETAKTRNPAFDIVKAAMMLWVVWGHLGLYGIVAGDSSVWMRNAKIGVNMPVFFVMSGYFAKSMFDRRNPGRMVARAVCFIWPQVVFATVCAFVFGIYAHSMNIYGVFHSVMGFWFLKSIAAVYLLSALVYCSMRTEAQRWAAFAMCYAAMLFCPSRLHLPWCGQVIHMFPYFVFGLMVLRRHPLHENRLAAFLCGAAFVAAVVLQGDSGVNGMNFWKVNAHWRIVFSNMRDFATFFARTLVGLAGSLFVLSCAGFVCRKIRCAGGLAEFGTTSLGVYVIHEYPLQLAGNHFHSPLFPPWSRWIVALCWFLICHCAIVFVKRRRALRVAFFGDEGLVAAAIDRVAFKRLGLGR